MPDWYERKDQRLYICNEESYGQPRGESAAWTKISASSTYPQRLNIIPEGIDVPIPTIQKLKKYDISSFKYPSNIVSGNIEPVTFSIEMELQRPVFLAYAVGSAVSTMQNLRGGTTDGVTTAGTATFTSATGGLDDTIAGDILHILDKSDRGYYEVLRVESATELTLKNANFNGETACTFEVYDAFKHVITEELGTNAESFTLHIEIPNDDDGSNLDSGDDGVTTVSTKTFSVVGEAFQTKGVTAGDILTMSDGDDAGTYEIKSVDSETQLTVYAEADFLGDTAITYSINEPDNRMAYDLFGCVVEEYKLTISKGNGTIKETVSISSPACDTSANILTVPPNSILFDDVYVFANLTEKTDTEDWQLLQEAYASRRPDSTETVTLTIKNNFSFKGDLGYRGMVYAIPTKRNVTLDIGGYISEKNLMTYWEKTWNQANNRPDDALGNLNSVIYLYMNANKYIKIPISNLTVDAFSTNFITIDEGIKRADITLTEAPPPAAAGDKMFYEIADSEDGIIIYDQFSEDMYHHEIP